MIVESTNVENMHKSPAFAKPLLGVVKEKRTSLFCGWVKIFYFFLVYLVYMIYICIEFKTKYNGT